MGDRHQSFLQAIGLVSLIGLSSCAITTTPAELLHEYESRREAASMATIPAELWYQGSTASYHHFRLHHGGLNRSSNFRISSQELPTEIRLDHTEDETSWQRCSLQRTGQDRYTLVLLEAASHDLRFREPPE